MTMEYFILNTNMENFSDMLYTLKSKRRYLYSIMYDIQSATNVCEATKGNYRQFMMCDYVELDTKIQLFEFSFDKKNIELCNRICGQPTMIDGEDVLSNNPFDKYDLNKMSRFTKKIDKILKEWNSDVERLNLDIPPASFDPENPLIIQLTSLSEKIKEDTQLQKDKLTEKFSEVLYSSSDNKKDILDQIIKKHIIDIEQRETLIIRVKICISAGGSTDTLIEDDRSIIDDINDYLELGYINYD